MVIQPWDLVILRIVEDLDWNSDAQYCESTGDGKALKEVNGNTQNIAIVSGRF